MKNEMAVPRAPTTAVEMFRTGCGTSRYSAVVALTVTRRRNRTLPLAATSSNAPTRFFMYIALPL